MAAHKYRKTELLLADLLEKIGSASEPQPVAVQPEEYALAQNCFPNVEQKVLRDGGQIHYGWMIHETALLLEAERHAVWESRSGELLDITPHGEGITEIRFVSDASWQYTGTIADNIRINRTTNPVVDDFILLGEALTKIMSYGRRENGDSISLPHMASIAYQLYEPWKTHLQQYIMLGGGPFTSCICGSGKTYKSCHGRELHERLASDMQTLKAAYQSPA